MKRVEKAKLPTIVAIVAALAGPPLFVIVPDRFLREPRTLSVQVSLEILYWGLLAVVLWVVLAKERRPLQSIGLRPPRFSTFAFALLFWVSGMFVLPLITTPFVNAIGRTGWQAGVQEL